MFSATDILITSAAVTGGVALLLVFRILMRKFVVDEDGAITKRSEKNTPFSEQTKPEEPILKLPAPEAIEENVSVETEQWTDYSQSQKLYVFGGLQAAAAIAFWVFVFLELTTAGERTGFRIKGLGYLTILAIGFTGWSFSSLRQAVGGIIRHN